METPNLSFLTVQVIETIFNKTNFNILTIFLPLNDYTTIPRMTNARLTKWRSDFHKLTIQRLFFIKKAKNFLFLSLMGVTKTPLIPLTGFENESFLPLTRFFYPWRDLIF